jgi:hypothetical protein
MAGGDETRLGSKGILSGRRVNPVPMFRAVVSCQSIADERP